MEQLTFDLGPRPVVNHAKHEAFRAWHRRALPPSFYAMDDDLVLVDQQGVVALIEFKTPGYEQLTFAQIIRYGEAVRQGTPVFVVVSEPPFSRFEVAEFEDGNPTAGTAILSPVMAGNAEAFGAWEQDLRYARLRVAA